MIHTVDKNPTSTCKKKCQSSRFVQKKKESKKKKRTRQKKKEKKKPIKAKGKATARKRKRDKAILKKPCAPQPIPH